MKLIVITTKKECYDGLVERCCPSYDYFVLKDNTGSEVNVYYNKFEEEDSILCILPTVDENQSNVYKANYSLDLVVKTIHFIKTKEVEKNDIFLLLHSGDFFVNGDDHRIDSILNLNWLDHIVDSVLLSAILELVEPSHIYQFRHKATEYIWKKLSIPSNDNRCKNLLRIFK